MICSNYRFLNTNNHKDYEQNSVIFPGEGIMLKIEDILNGTDMFSIIFRDSLMKIGQLTTDYIFGTPDVAALKNDIIPKIISPATQFTDCKIRIKDFNKLNFNIIFLMKDATMRGVQRVIEKEGCSKDIKISIDRNTLIKYQQEIDKNNYQKIYEFIEKNRKLNTQIIMQIVETGVTKVKPWANYRIDLTMGELLNTYYPVWKTYLTDLINKCFSQISKLEEEKVKKLDTISLMIEKNGYYKSPDIYGLPRLVDFRNKLLFDIKGSDSKEITKEDIDKFILDKNNFTIFRVATKKGEPAIYGTLDGESYKIYIDNTGNLVISENTEQGFTITDKKVNYFREKIKLLVNPEIRIEMKAKYESYESVYILFKKKKNEIFDKIIENNNFMGLKIVDQLLEIDKTDPSYKIYKLPVANLITANDNAKTNELLLDFVKKNSKSTNFFAKIFSILFPTVNEADIENQLIEEKNKIAAVTKTVSTTEIKPSGKQSETPAMSAIKILKQSGQLENVKMILKSTNDNNNKVRTILRLCTDIGNTNKAHIERSDKTKSDFLKELKYFIDK